MTHEPVSRPISLRAGVSGTSGRPPVATPKQPQLDEEALRLVASLVANGSTLTPQDIAKFAERVTANPSRSGVQALSYLAWSCRAATEVDFAETIEKLCVALTHEVGVKEGFKALAVAAEKSIGKAYNRGFADGQEALRQQLPAVVRETTFISDDKGHITGKTEREYTPGGKT
jgi:hypothetical protein